MTGLRALLDAVLRRRDHDAATRVERRRARHQDAAMRRAVRAFTGGR